MKKIILASILAVCSMSMQAQFHGGSGTEKDPYLVADSYDLADIANYTTSYFRQIADIDVTEWIADNSPFLGWMPIGTSDKPFEGGFDGGNYTIKGLYINRPNQNDVGLFGYVRGQIIQNVILESPNLTGGDNTGSVVGYVESVELENCKIYSPNVRGKEHVGCVVGICYGDGFNHNISNCVIISAIAEGTSNVGGICGRCLSATISQCRAEIMSLYAMENCVGGIVGEAMDFQAWDLTHGINNCEVFALNMIGVNYVGGIAGESDYILSNNTSIVNHIIGSDYVGGIVGFSGNDVIQNYAFANISGVISGGICGEVMRSTFGSKSYPNGEIVLYANNAFDGSVNSTTAGGVVGINYGSRGTEYSNKLYYTYNGANVKNCLVRGAQIIATENAAGIDGFQSKNNSSYNVENCVSLATLISSKTTDNAYRIVGNTYGRNNKAYNQTEVIRNNKKVINIEDNAQNGVAYGEKTLMRSSTYTGLDWDFNTIWTMQEGESYPYFQAQTDYPVVTVVKAGNKTSIKGTCKSNGRLTVIRNNEFIKTQILDNTWEVALGTVSIGDTLLIYSQADNKMPSVVVQYVYDGNNISYHDDNVPGDANGDGVVDSADVTAIINYILGKPSASFKEDNADVTGDGEILIDDAVNTVQLIMNAQ